MSWIVGSWNGIFLRLTERKRTWQEYLSKLNGRIILLDYYLRGLFAKTEIFLSKTINFKNFKEILEYSNSKIIPVAVLTYCVWRHNLPHVPLLLADVLALAAAIGELTTHTRSARTAQWCALQMSLNDMPVECRRAIDCATNNNSPKQRLLEALQARDAHVTSSFNMAANSSSATSSAAASPLLAAASSLSLNGDGNNNNRK